MQEVSSRGRKGQCLLIYSVWSFVFTGVNLAFTTQLRAELGAWGFPVRFEVTISRRGSRIGAPGEQLHTWVTSDTHHLIKEICLVRSPCQGPASLGEAAGSKGFVRLPSGQPGTCPALALPPSPATVPGQGLVSGGQHQPVDLSVGSPALWVSVGSPCFSPKNSVSTGNPCFRLGTRFTVDFGDSHAFLCFCAISAVSTAAQQLHLRDILLPCRVLYRMNNRTSAMYFRVRLTKSPVQRRDWLL